MKAFKIIYYVFFGCIAAIALLLLVSVFPITGNVKIFTVLSGSMEPAIKTGSIVLVKPVSNYKIGDAITFGPVSKTKVPTTHRIAEIMVDRGNPVYITKGDANNASDTRNVVAKDIIGKVLVDVPYAGYAVATAQQPWGFAGLIIFPAVLIIADEAKKIFKQVKNLRKEKQNGDAQA